MSQPSERRIASDCRFFKGDRPCIWHKREGAVCECERYDPVHGEVLIIKLDAVGDVLRTTCLLPAITQAWPRRRVSWITRPDARPLLENNPYIDEIISYGTDALVQLGARSFERVINLDSGKRSAGLAAMARAGEKIGFVLHEDGYVTATNPAAEEWLRMGLFDNLKRANQRTYQSIMCSIVGVRENELRYVLELTEEEKLEARRHLRSIGVDLDKTMIGIHSGGGGRWKLKQWHEERFVQLTSELDKQLGSSAQILLFGGPLERERNRRIREAVPDRVLDTGCDNSLRHFAALVDCCSVMLSGDSLAMHVALARGCRAVVLFGPTSHAEIELFGRGKKIIPPMDCLVCYKTDCDFDPNCMDLISVEQVKAAVVSAVDASVSMSAEMKKPVP